MMKRMLALWCAFLCTVLLSGCDWITNFELAEPLPEPSAEEPAETSEEAGEPEEPEGSKAITILFAHAADEESGRSALLEGARQFAESKGYALSSVETLGRPDLQSRFVEMARDAGEQAILVELIDPSDAEAVAELAGDMAVVFIDTAPESNSVLGKRVIYVGNSDGKGDLYLRLTGRTAMCAADNLLLGQAADQDTDLKLSGHKITVPADGVLPV